MTTRYKTVSQPLRYKILERDNYTCQDCGLKAHAGLLQIHHINPYVDSRDDHPENLTTLCKPCHEKADKAHKSALVRAARARYFADKTRGLTKTLRIRVNAAEKAQVQEIAEEAGMTVSDFIRSRIGL